MKHTDEQLIADGYDFNEGRDEDEGFYLKMFKKGNKEVIKAYNLIDIHEDYELELIATHYYVDSNVVCETKFEETK